MSSKDNNPLLKAQEKINEAKIHAMELVKMFKNNNKILQSKKEEFIKYKEYDSDSIINEVFKTEEKNECKLKNNDKCINNQNEINNQDDYEYKVKISNSRLDETFIFDYT